MAKSIQIYFDKFSEIIIGLNMDHMRMKMAYSPTMALNFEYLNTFE